MIDMRRYLRSGSSAPLRNLASTAITRVRQERRRDLRGDAAQDEGEHGRAQEAEHRPRRLREALRCYSRSWARAKRSGGSGEGLRNPLICMTNVGELDSKRLAFEGTSVESAYICGSIKHKPHFQLALCGFDGTLTLSSNLYGKRRGRGDRSRPSWARSRKS